MSPWTEACYLFHGLEPCDARCHHLSARRVPPLPTQLIHRLPACGAKRTLGGFSHAQGVRLACHVVVISLFTNALAIGAAPVDEKFGKTCTTSECHPMPSKNDGAIAHVPFLEEWCDRCHSDHTGSKPGLISLPEPDLCLACHTNIETEEGQLAHPDGQTNCTSCHNPHRSDVRHLLRDDNHLLGCVECHGEELAREREKPHHHQYFDPERECGSCHFAHRNSEDKYLRPNVGETCLTCHDMSIQVEGRKLENIGTEMRTSPHTHPPASEGLCQACHTPHGSVQPSLLKDSYPAGNYERYERENYQLCWQCHDPSIAEADPTWSATGFRDGSKNLHQVHVVKFGKGRACHLCHTAHAAERPHLLRETIRFGSWAGPLEYEEKTDGGSCTTACHRPKDYKRASE